MGGVVRCCAMLCVECGWRVVGRCRVSSCVDGSCVVVARRGVMVLSVACRRVLSLVSVVG